MRSSCDCQHRCGREPGWCGRVNPGEALINVVIKAKRKLLKRLDQNGTRPGPGAPNSPSADDEPPAERRDLNRTQRLHARNVVSPSSPCGPRPQDSDSQEMPMGRRVKEEGASEGRSVMDRIGVALQSNIIPRRKPADFPLVFRHERTLAN